MLYIIVWWIYINLVFGLQNNALKPVVFSGKSQVYAPAFIAVACAPRFLRAAAYSYYN